MSSKKYTLSCRVEEALKVEIEAEAQVENLSIAQYLLGVVKNRHRVPVKAETYEEMKELLERIQQLETKNEQLQAQISIPENSNEALSAYYQSNNETLLKELEAAMQRTTEVQVEKAKLQKANRQLEYAYMAAKTKPQELQKEIVQENEPIIDLEPKQKEQLENDLSTLQASFPELPKSNLLIGCVAVTLKNEKRSWFLEKLSDLSNYKPFKTFN